MDPTIRQAMCDLMDRIDELWDDLIAVESFCKTIYAYDPVILEWLTYYCAKRSLACWEFQHDSKQPRDYVDQISYYFNKKSIVDWKALTQPIQSPYGDCRYSEMSSVSYAISGCAKYIYGHDPVMAANSIVSVDIAFDHVFTEDNFRLWLIDIATEIACEKRDMNESELNALRVSI